MNTREKLIIASLKHLRAHSVSVSNAQTISFNHADTFFDVTADKMLSSADWGFGVTTEELTVSSNSAPGWTNVYEYPADCLSILYLTDSLNGQSAIQDGYVKSIPYDNIIIKDSNNEFQRFIVSNTPNLHAYYRARNHNYDMWTPDFKMAFTYLLASEVSISVLGLQDGTAVKGELLGMYNAYLRDTLLIQENERHINLETESDFAAVRRGSTSIVDHR